MSGRNDRLGDPYSLPRPSPRRSVQVRVECGAGIGGSEVALAWIATPVRSSLSDAYLREIGV